MYKVQKILVLSVFALSFTAPAFALEINADRDHAIVTSPGVGNGSGNSKYPYQEWMGEEGRPERKELREEREQIRIEHEQLQSERDRLKVECLNTKGQERSACEKKIGGLKEKRQALHERMKAFHEKAQAAKFKRHKKNKANDAAKKKTEKPAAPTKQ